MITRETLYNVKQYDFYIHDNKEPSVVLKYTTQSKTNKIEHVNIFINNACVEMMSVLNFANIMFELVKKDFETSNILKLYEQLKLGDDWKFEKIKTKLNATYSKIISTPYLYFKPFNATFKTQKFEEIYEKYNIKIGEQINE